mgnify:CR=1 FL=1
MAWPGMWRILFCGHRSAHCEGSHVLRTLGGILSRDSIAQGTDFVPAAGCIHTVDFCGIACCASTIFVQYRTSNLLEDHINVTTPMSTSSACLTFCSSDKTPQSRLRHQASALPFPYSLQQQAHFGKALMWGGLLSCRGLQM